MDIQEFIDKFAEIFDDIDASSLSVTTIFKDLEEWSSLSSLGLIALADDEFEVELTGNEIKEASTIEDIYNLIISKV